jgi:mRNA-degrading endonuclease RelE of RelBE toxin-antitoxin system
MRSFSTTTAFDNQLKKLDSSIKSKIIKRMQKVIEKLELGKPLHAPLVNHFSERIEKYRIIYTFNQEQVTFVYLDHREKVYGKI